MDFKINRYFLKKYYKSFLYVCFLFINLLIIDSAYGAPLMLDFNYSKKVDNKEVEKDDDDLYRGEIKNISVKLFYEKRDFFNNPVKSENHENGDEIEIRSKLQGVEDKSEYLYRWSIEANKENSTDFEGGYWEDITDIFVEKNKTTGRGLDNFNFRLNISNEKLEKIFGHSSSEKDYYIRVKLNVSKEIDEKKDYAIGKVTETITFKNVPDSIIIGLAEIDVEGKLLFNPDNQICFEGSQGQDCMVIKDEIMALSIHDDDKKYREFKWIIDGVEVKCNQSISPHCDDPERLETVFFPVSGLEGDKLEVRLEMKDIYTGSIKRISRVFAIIKPKIKIESQNQEVVWNKKVGKKDAFSGDENLGISQGIFQALSGSKIPLKVSPEPSWLRKKSSIRWLIDGKESDIYKGKWEIELGADQISGSILNLETRLSYVQSPEAKKLLADIWGKNISLIGEKKTENSIQIEILKNENKDITLTQKARRVIDDKKDGLSKNIGFFLRLILSSLILLIMTSLLFKAFPNLPKKG